MCPMMDYHPIWDGLQATHPQPQPEQAMISKMDGWMDGNVLL